MLTREEKTCGESGLPLLSTLLGTRFAEAVDNNADGTMTNMDNAQLVEVHNEDLERGSLLAKVVSFITLIGVVSQGFWSPFALAQLETYPAEEILAPQPDPLDPLGRLSATAGARNSRINKRGRLSRTTQTIKVSSRMESMSLYAEETHRQTFLPASILYDGF